MSKNNQEELKSYASTNNNDSGLEESKSFSAELDFKEKSVNQVKSEQYSPNVDFFYRGNDIIKLWEQYLKTIKSEIKFGTLSNDDEPDPIVARDSMFHEGGITQKKEVALVLLSGDSLYKNKDGYSLTLCGEINDENDVTNLSKAIDQIKKYNSHGDDRIKNHIIVFPYHITSVHWNLGVVKLSLSVQEDNSTIISVQKDNSTIIIDGKISIYEPYGGKARNNSTKLVQNIGKLIGENIIRRIDINAEEQQRDSSSCGAITAENGKEFLKIKDDGCNLLNSIYQAGAKELRKIHIEEINAESFSKAQSENKTYEAEGDKAIENKDEIIKHLKELIQKDENKKLGEVIHNLATVKILTREDDESNRKNFDLFKQFLIKIDLSDGTDYAISRKILESNGKFKEGAIDLICEFAKGEEYDCETKFSNDSNEEEEKSLYSSEKKEDSRPNTPETGRGLKFSDIPAADYATTIIDFANTKEGFVYFLKSKANDLFKSRVEKGANEACSKLQEDLKRKVAKDRLWDDAEIRIEFYYKDELSFFRLQHKSLDGGDELHSAIIEQICPSSGYEKGVVNSGEILLKANDYINFRYELQDDYWSVPADEIIGELLLRWPPLNLAELKVVLAAINQVKDIELNSGIGYKGSVGYTELDEPKKLLYCYSVERKDMQVAKVLLDCGINPNEEYNGTSIIKYLCDKALVGKALDVDVSCKSMIKLCINYGANISALDKLYEDEERYKELIEEVSKRVDSLNEKLRQDIENRQAQLKNFLAEEIPQSEIANWQSRKINEEMIAEAGCKFVSLLRDKSLEADYQSSLSAFSQLLQSRILSNLRGIEAAASDVVEITSSTLDSATKTIAGQVPFVGAILQSGLGYTIRKRQLETMIKSANHIVSNQQEDIILQDYAARITCYLQAEILKPEDRKEWQIIKLAESAGEAIIGQNSNLPKHVVNLVNKYSLEFLLYLGKEYADYQEQDPNHLEKKQQNML